MLHENELATKVLDICFEIHRELGPGMLESVYETILCYELDKAGIGYLRQHPVQATWDGKLMGTAFKADVIVERKLLLELKSVEALHPKDFKQTTNFLKITRMRLGLLINFNEPRLSNGIRRIANGLTTDNLI